MRRGIPHRSKICQFASHCSKVWFKRIPMLKINTNYFSYIVVISVVKKPHYADDQLASGVTVRGCNILCTRPAIVCAPVISSIIAASKNASHAMYIFKTRQR